MANQMKPDELRIAAEDVDNWIDPTGNAHVAAQAARNLADVIEYVEPLSEELIALFAGHAPKHLVAAEVLEIARGETNDEYQQEARAEFDRWLAEHDAKVRAETLREFAHSIPGDIHDPRHIADLARGVADHIEREAGLK